MARNRKRRSAGRTRRPGDGTTARTGAATANGGRADEAPDPLEHATPDVELAEEQLMVGRPELTEAEIAENERLDVDDGYDEGDDSEPEDREPQGAHSASTSMAVRRPNPGVRLVEFLRGSWRELQRVQWPDRRQVMQATGVVIGFVIVAGVYLGLADLVASKVVKLILP
ncbi:MAG TPA: preprotein translocase subunit SecE [Solirubrobacteraceae bacterium]